MNHKIARWSCAATVTLVGLTAAGSALASPVAPAASFDRQSGAVATGSTQVDSSSQTDRSAGWRLPSVSANGGSIIKLKLRNLMAGSLGGDRLAVAGAGSSELASVLDGMPGMRIEPLFDLSSTDLAGLREGVSIGRSTPAVGLDPVDELGNWYQLVVPAGTDAEALARRLGATAGVVTAFIAPVNSTPTIDYTGDQGYRRAASTGIDVSAAAGVAGGQGDRVKIFDIEFSWNMAHEDLGRAAHGLIANGTFADPFKDTNHGTSVLGEMVGSANGFGVTGIAPKAAIGMVNAYNTERKWDVAGAIALAAAHANRGDVILIEQQSSLSDKKDDWGPVEYYQDAFDAIRAATNKGVIVIEAAGNGFNDLDKLGVGRTDSGAIMVGAGQVDNCAGWGSTHHPRSRAEFSNYGSRVDVQAWGECVTTTGHTGYGDYAGGSVNAWYTYSFGGTSSASPIVAGSAAIVSSVIEAREGRAATPAEVRSLLKSTGVAQDISAGTLPGHIGPMPNIRAALAKLGTLGGGNDGGNGGNNGGGQTVDRTAPAVTAPTQKLAAGYQLTDRGLIPTTIAWNATDASGVARYAVKVSTDGAAWTDVTLSSATAKSITLNLTPGHSYRFIVAARDGAGNWSDWSKGITFYPGSYDDNATGITYSTGWVRSTWAAALDGSLAVSSEAGATARIDFTGRGFAWVATQATNRGQARVWLDGTYLGIVDLHRSSTLARAMVLSRTVSTGRTHQLIIQVVGTAGRPNVDIDGLVILK